MKPGNSAVFVIENKLFDFKEFVKNDLEIITTRTVFNNGNNSLERIDCPYCKFNNIENNWGNALNEWYLGARESGFSCSNCSKVSPVEEYIFTPEWQFGELGFIFWNWPKFTSDFILEMEAMLNHKITIIYGRL